MATKRINYRLGLDVGTNSLGWSVLALDAKGQVCRIEAAGSRIFSDGRDAKTYATKAADRRLARSARRRRDRFLQRQRFLLSELTKAGLFPKDPDQRLQLQKQDPLELRARALHEQLELYQIGRALFHLNQRRGFKSNRKDRSEETVSGKVSKSYRNLLQEMQLIEPGPTDDEYQKMDRAEKKAAREAEAKERGQSLAKLAAQPRLTYGAFLWERRKQGKSTRARPSSDGKLYDVYPIRELYEDEFEKIWAAQTSFHLELMTEAKRKRIHHVIFTQRPLKPVERGRCLYMSGEERTFRAMPSFQRYRIYQEVHNLRWDFGRQWVVNYREARDRIVGLLKAPSLKTKPNDRNAQVGFATMKNAIKALNIDEGNLVFNSETPKRKGFDGDQTANVMQHSDYIGPDWHKWPLDKQDEFIGLILSDQTDEEVLKQLQQDYSLPEHVAEKCMNAPLVEGTAGISLKAARLILEKMRDEFVNKETGEVTLPLQPAAAAAVAKEVEEFVDPMRRPKTEEDEFQPWPRLPYYGKFFEDGRHIIPGSREEKDQHDPRKYYGGITNPTVHVALNQIRQVVNELIGRYGHPTSIAIELGRELPAGEDKRREIDREQKKNQLENEGLDEKLRELGQSITPDNRDRLRFWKEAKEECVFSGRIIGVNDLFSGDCEIEHLIPFSISLDNSRSNKVICARQANRDKGNKTPFQAFGQSPKGYNWSSILERVKNLPEPKQWRFQEDALEIWQRGEGSDFTARHLNDTRYIGRLTREYLEAICHVDKIDVLTGRLTALLRRFWGLNSVLDRETGEIVEPPSTEAEEVEINKKSRDDHRHHAVDAIVVGMTTKSMLQRVSTEANKAEEINLDRLFENYNALDPWTGFRDNVRQIANEIVVSHKPVKKPLDMKTTDGQLHNETALGLIKPVNEEKNEWQTVVRRPISYLKERKHIESIRDAKQRERFLHAFTDGGADAVKEFADKYNIRSLRCFGPKQAIPIRNKSGKIYKGYQGDSNWGIEIYSFPTGHKKHGKWEGVVISRFAANKVDFKSGQTYRPHPAAKLIMRLQINDYIIAKENSKNKIFRLHKVNQGGQMCFAPHNEANAAQRDVDGKGDSFKFMRKQADTMRALKPRKIHISPTGRISYEKR